MRNLSTDAQFGARLDKLFGSNSGYSNSNINKELQNLLDEMREILKEDLKVEIDGIIKQASSEILGDSAFSQAFGEGVEKAFGQIIAGKRVDARSVANSVARVLAPSVDDFFRKSSSQAADEISSLFNLSQRNL